ncbi:MAG: hypothetical protein EA398_03590, partial [Deltaproteobacteria bacterium]
MLLLTTATCTGSSDLHGGGLATGAYVDLLVRVQLQDGTSARGRDVFLQIPQEAISAHALGRLEAEWSSPEADTEGLFRDSEGNWWTRIDQSNP